MVNVIAQDGQPLTPTKNHAKIRVLLKGGKTVKIREVPFTVQLFYDPAARWHTVSGTEAK